MAKTLQFRDGEADGTTGRFLLAVTHEAHRRLAPDQAEGVVAEVRDHLNVQVETEVMNGVARLVAERQAVAGFGSASRFVRGVSQSLHDTRQAHVARQATFALACVTFVGLFFLISLCETSIHASLNTPWRLLWIPVIAVMVGSWLGWRAMPRQYAILGAVFVLATVCWKGFDTVTLPPQPGQSVAPWESVSSRQYSRWQMRRAATTATIWRDMAQQDVNELDAGTKAFGISSEADTLRLRLREFIIQHDVISLSRQIKTVEMANMARNHPDVVRAFISRNAAEVRAAQAQLQAMEAEIQVSKAQHEAQYANSDAIKPFRTADGKYIAPLTYVGFGSSQSAFVGVPRQRMERGTYESAGDYARRYQQAIAQTPPVQMGTFLQARRRWMDNGPRWLQVRKAELAYRERTLENCRRVAAAPLGFNLSATNSSELWALLTLPFFLVALNVVPATLARITRRAWDSWVWRIRSTA